MNTANLQMAGLLTAVSCLLEAMRAKGLLTEQEIVLALDNAEAAARPQHTPEISPSNAEAIAFPIRFLKRAVNRTAGKQLSFADIAAMVGEAKIDR